MAVAIVCCSFQGVSCASQERSPADFAGYAILPGDDGAAEDLRWSAYLADHLRRRVAEPRLVAEVETDGLFRITVHVDSLLGHDFRVVRTRAGVDLVTRNREGMCWLQYQLMKRIGTEDARIESADLPPATVGLRDTVGHFTFDSRNIYTPSGQNADNSGILALETVDGAWGLWGHGLKQVLAAASSPRETYAIVDSEPYDGQYCFSSEATFRAFENYVIDNFGEGDDAPMRFVVAPVDDEAVCLCDRCRVAGNTPRSATPAAAGLVARLCARFPHHQFFLLGYLSTIDAPLKPLPANGGAILSAIELPLSAHADNPDFTGRLGQWRGATENLYIWDYMSNFDDYLTPFPALELLRRRFVYFRDHGVKGIFLNGSGYDYSSFDDVRTWVLSSLLLNPDQSPETLVRAYLADRYPLAGSLLADFYCDLERRASTSKRPLSLYGSIANAEVSGLDAATFIRFYDALTEQLPTLSGEERKQVHRLLTALSYTRLELARRHAADDSGCLILNPSAESGTPTATIRPQAAAWLEALSASNDFADMRHLTEAELSVAEYAAQWRSRILDAMPVSSTLLGSSVRALSPCDEDYTDLSVLTDGLHGLPAGYHFGWHISSVDLEIELPATACAGAHRFSMDFLNLSPRRIRAPRSLEIYKDGVLYKTITPELDATGRLATAAGTVDLSGASQLMLKVLRADDDRAQIATDEIYLIP